MSVVKEPASIDLLLLNARTTRRQQTVAVLEKLVIRIRDCGRSSETPLHLIHTTGVAMDAKLMPKCQVLYLE